MSILSELQGHLDDLAARAIDAETDALLSVMTARDDDDVVAAVAAAAAIKNAAERIVTVGAAVIAQRSTRDRGHSGLSAERGHPSPASLVQHIAGGTRAEAVRAVRLGESLLDADVPGDDGGGSAAGEAAGGEGGAGGDMEGQGAAPTAWHDPLRRAMLAGTITCAQHDAILRGLGEPPVPPRAAGELDGGDGVAEHEVDPAVVREVWSLAAVQLIGDAATVTVEELGRMARQVRDALDPAGAEERFARRYAARSFRTWTDADGLHHGHIIFDDERAAFIQAIRDAALRPRRGGPRFVTDEERAAADRLLDDPRTNDQLAYDLFMDVLCAGALAQASDVFGARQPGVRMIVVKGAIGPRDAFGRMLATGHLEDGGDALPGSVIDRNLCAVGRVEVTVDACGNPLDVGREQRLFTSRQRIALAVRDGGCRWPGCAVPASYCEAHHCDHWCENGATDIDRGILLCRHHHMLLHNNGWIVRRTGEGPFMLHPPPGRGDPVVMASRSAVRWAWDPPPDRPGWREHPAA